MNLRDVQLYRFENIEDDPSEMVRWTNDVWMKPLGGWEKIVVDNHINRPIEHSLTNQICVEQNHNLIESN